LHNVLKKRGKSQRIKTIILQKNRSQFLLGLKARKMLTPPQNQKDILSWVIFIERLMLSEAQSIDHPNLLTE